MTTVYVAFTATVKNHEYNYSATRLGEADLELEASREILDSLDAGDLFKVILGAALAKYDASEKEEEQE